MNFIQTPSTTLKAKLRNIGLVFLFHYFLYFIMGRFLIWIDPPTISEFSLFPIGPSHESLKHAIFFGSIWAPIWEELIFRHSVGLIVKRIGKEFLFPAMLISSYIFGWGHGEGPESLLKQGIMGFAYFWLYVKNGYSYWSSVAAHSAWNTFDTFLPGAIW